MMVVSRCLLPVSELNRLMLQALSETKKKQFNVEELYAKPKWKVIEWRLTVSFFGDITAATVLSPVVAKATRYD